MAQVTHHNQGSELHYIVTDHAGTPQELCNEQGDIVWRGEQALWGHYHGQSQRHWQRREEAANDSIQCDLRYQGQIEDPESSLYYNVNRYYDADSGQYLSPDPIGFAGGLRPQAYVANPLEWVDPLGLAGAAHGDEDEDVSKTAGKGEVFYKTTKEATAAAKELGFEKTKFKAHGETVYFNKKTKRYISRDVGSGDGNVAHNGGVWKMAKSVKDLGSKNSRIGTFDANLNKIGD